MTYKQNYHTNEELVKILEKRGCKVTDKLVLKKVNYSHLMYLFGKNYIVDEDEKNEPVYKSGTSLEHIYNLYLINLKFSGLMYEFFFKFEHKIKASVAHWTSEIAPLWYTDLNNFKQIAANNLKEQKRNEVEREKISKKLHTLEKKAKKKYDNCYLIEGKLPMWLLVDEMPVGLLTKLINFLEEETKEKVLNDLSVPSGRQNILRDIVDFRNQLFHGNPFK